ncbi:TIGR03668 family PPOX class F420-dependent oxidoreductase [Amycolatopsis cihanbeyliensis]|uniref:PPOX class probable F420-dependent enzyme n=1 Tax=Amycolatopsis cihanbeyliensis TaxID=1128664 RepID=A0A542DBZ7_AMYCI|nr:TIGR03668 family PPOX class F420-dependent oxidoreductase [Amycolatopsis cihanbeyliensis]TQJ00602.1 PPOX class probable F420-dependent enzyme [Amycolatopsis cihanbeyliensis]
MRLSPDETRHRFASAPVARLATADASGRPHLVPVTFALLDSPDAVVFAVDHKPKRRTDLRRLRNIGVNPEVSFLVDHYQDDWSGLWWARADGRATVHADPEPGSAPLAALRAKYPQYAERPPEGPVVLTEVARWAGWSFS